MDIKKGFVKPPLSQKEKEKLEKKFMEGANPDAQEEQEEEPLGEIKTKTIIIRAPVSYHQNLLKIRKITGMTINGVCLELLWPAIKQKLKDLGID
jgi:hypothetical protein